MIIMLKKILSSRRPKKKKIICHRVKVRVKVRKKLFKKISIVLAGFLLTGLLIFSLKTVYVFGSDKIKSGVFSTEIKSLDIEMGNERVNSEILDLFRDKIGKKWNTDLKKNIKIELLSKYPYISGARVSKNILTGTVSIRGKLEKIVSKITLNNKECYLSLSGRVFLSAYKEAFNHDLVQAEISAGKKPELRVFAEFIDKINLSKKSFDFKPVLIKYNLIEEKCSIVLEDKSLVNWGKFELTDLKILKLNRVLSDVAGRMPAPYKVDLKHFAIGKVFISEL